MQVDREQRARLIEILWQVVKYGELGVFLLVAGVTAGPWEVTGASIALIGSFQQIPTGALGGLLILCAATSGIPPEGPKR